MRQYLCFAILMLACALPAEAAVSVQDSQAYVTINTGKVSATFRKKQGILIGLKCASGEVKSGWGIFAPRLIPGLSAPAGSYPQLPGTLRPGKDGKVTFEVREGAANGTAVRAVWRTDRAQVTQEWTFNDDAAEIPVAVEAQILTDTYEISFLAREIQGLDKATILPEPGRPAYGHDFRRTPAFLCAAAGDRSIGLSVSVPPPGSEQNADLDRVASELSDKGPSLSTYFRGITPAKKSYRGSFTLTLGKPQEGPPQWQAMEGEPWKTRAPVVIVDLWPDKIIYDNQQRGSLGVTLLNCTSERRAVALKVDLERGLVGRESLGPMQVALGPSERKRVEVPFNSGARDFGVRCVARVLTGGRKVNRATEVFGVATDWKKLFQFCIYYPKGYEWGAVQRMRENYLSVAHVFSWYPKEGILTPRGDKMYDSIQAGLKKNAIWFKQFNEACRKAGIKSNMYYWLGGSGPGAGWEADPTMMTYTPNGQAIYSANLYDPRFRKFLAEQFIESIDYFGWDSCMIDCITVLKPGEDAPFSFFNYRDFSGRKAGLAMGPDADTAGEAWLEELKERVRRKHPRFVFMGNGVGPGVGLLKTTGIGPKVYLAGEVILTELGGGGTAVTAKHGVGTWKGLVECLNSQSRERHLTELDGQTLDKYPHYVYIPTPYGGAITTKAYLGLCFANGFHTYNWWPAEALDLRGQAHSRYNRFSLRWGEFLYDLERIEWVPTEKVDFVSVGGAGSVLWKDYVYWRREKDGSRDLIIHFLNLPPEEYVWKNTRPPQAQRDLALRVVLPQNARPAAAWWLSPDEGDLPQELKFSSEGNELRTSIPRLEYYGLVVIRTVR